MHTREPMNDAAEREAGARLAEALAALPEPAPPVDGWIRIEARLGAPPARAWQPTVAVAACALLLAIALVLRPPANVAPSVPEAPATLAGPPDSAGALEHADWQRRSRRLERVLAALPDPQRTNAATGYTTALLEDRIALVDERLSDAAEDRVTAGQRDALLRERVLLLDSLVRVRSAAALEATL